MDKWADYLISKVKKDNNGDITDVWLHVDNGNTVSYGGVRKASQVINLIDTGYSVNTILWVYPNWIDGSRVSVVNGTYHPYLRTRADDSSKDNLDNLILL